MTIEPDIENSDDPNLTSIEIDTTSVDASAGPSGSKQLKTSNQPKTGERGS